MGLIWCHKGTCQLFVLWHKLDVNESPEVFAFGFQLLWPHARLSRVHVAKQCPGLWILLPFPVFAMTAGTSSVLLARPSKFPEGFSIQALCQHQCSSNWYDRVTPTSWLNLKESSCAVKTKHPKSETWHGSVQAMRNGHLLGSSVDFRYVRSQTSTCGVKFGIAHSPGAAKLFCCIVMFTELALMGRMRELE